MRVVDSRTEWQKLYKQGQRALLEHVGHLVVDIQHVGSKTTVPGLEAKPILDVAVAASSTEIIPRLEQPLGELGYIYRGDAGGDGGHVFVKESAPDIRTHHLCVVAVDDPHWR